MDPPSVLEDQFYQSLLINRKMLIENIIFSQEMVNSCIEKKIISGENVSEFKKSTSNAERIDFILRNLQLKSSKYFFDFCEMLMICGQPLVAHILQDYASNDIEITIEDLFEEMPILKRSLRPKDKEQLLKYITEKVKAESVKAIVTNSKERQRKESIARVNQIQQSMQLKKDLKVKEKESYSLKEQLQSVEDQLLQKQNQLKLLEKEFKERKRKQEEDLLLATSFNSVNDKELQRAELSVNLFKKMINRVIEKIKIIFPAEKNYEKLLHESSENQMKKYDIEKQIEIFNEIMDKVIDIFNYLTTEMRNYEILQNDVSEAKRLLFPQREQSENLTHYINDYQNMITNTVKSLQNKIDLQENVIYGKIAEELLPIQYQNIQIPSTERDEYVDIIKELQSKTRNLESMLAAKEKDFEKFITQKMIAEKEIYLHSDNIKEEERPTLKQFNSPYNLRVRENNGDKKPKDIPFSYRSNYKTRESRIYENKLKRSNVLKISSVNFL